MVSIITDVREAMLSISEGRHISIPKNLECVIARRLIKENNLDLNIKPKRNAKSKSFN